MGADLGDAMHAAMHPAMIAGLSIASIAALVIGVAVLGAWAIEAVVRRFVPLSLRRTQSDAAAAMFAVIGTTFAVLLAFVAMLSWESFNKAEASSHDEAAAIADIGLALTGLPTADAAALHALLADYARTVMQTEWPMQRRGEKVRGQTAPILALNARAASMQPHSLAESNLQARLLRSITHLAEARVERVRLADATMPGIIWTTLLLGGALTIAAASFVAAPSVWVHLAMSSVLAVSGALVLVLIIALSNPFRGDFRVSDRPYRDVLVSLDQPPQ